MKFNFCKKVLAFSLAAGLVALAFGRVGPVSAYGELLAGKNSSGKGQIYGKCKGTTQGNEVAVQGMSLFWSISSDVGSPFWTAEYVNGLVQKQNIQLIRAPMGVDEDWGSGNYFTKNGYYQGLMNSVVQSAIDNDIYVIIDYHSHKASDNVENAKAFFSYMAQKWGKYDNVIFEVFNEPIAQNWSTIKTYAEAVIASIRQYSDNLVLVGSRQYDQYPNEAINSPILDSKNNVAYTFHYYAGTHQTGREGANAVAAMNSGLPIFVSEWGTVDASGNGGFNSSNSTTWYNWMKQHKLSGANWSVSNKSESASYFNGSAWNYSESGNWVNQNIFANLPTQYTACSSTTPTSSSSVAVNSSSSQPEGTTDYIDDLEDGDNFAFTGGEWYAYTDNSDNGASTITNSPDTKGDYNVVLTGESASNQTKYVAGITGITLSKGQNKYDPYVALGVGLNATQTAYDLSKCSAITYKYKGAAHNFKAEDTAVKDYGYHQITKTATASWTTVTVPWDMLVQESWADDVTLNKSRIAKLTWEIKGKTPTYNYLYVDDVRCTGMAIKPVTQPKSSSSAKSSSSIASSSSAKSSSSMSSSSAKSSSSVASSSSAKSSSSKAELTISGQLKQTVQKGAAISPIIFTNVDKGYRQTQNAYYLNVSKSGNVLVVDGIVPDYANVGKVTESIFVNDKIYEIEITIEDKTIESSSSSLESSSSEIVSDEWASNAQITNNGSTTIIGSTSDWVSERIVKKNLGEVKAGESYKVSFDIELAQNTMNAQVDVGAYCSDAVELSATTGAYKYSCIFKASANENVALTLTMPGSRWEQVSISNLALQTNDGETTAIANVAQNTLHVTFEGRTINIFGANSATVNIFDMQGRPVASFKHVTHAIELNNMRAGNYIVRIRDTNFSITRKVTLK